MGEIKVAFDKAEKENRAALIGYVVGCDPTFEDSKLIINELPLGESESFLSVSDDPEDIKKSILSIEAILSRKVTILNMKSYK